MTRPLLFFLGGRDLEMTEIAALVRAELGPEAVADKGPPWHAAKASLYAAEIEAALAADRQPVLVELAPDLPAPVLARCILVDHHGERAGADRPTSLEQVWALLDLPSAHWTRRLALVAANDRGWVPELAAAGAGAAEIAAVRAEDRAAQGIGADEEAAALDALDRAERLLGGALILVRLPHSRTATVADRLALAALPELPPTTLILSPAEVNFSGPGAAVAALAAAFPSGWWGGALPERGFWGKAAPLPAEAALLAIVETSLTRTGPA